ncbi:MAG: PHP domain-containing protein [Candidatus Abyssubacteria bacterium]
MAGTNVERYVDLHVHTHYSDGSFSPEEVVCRARKVGLSAIGIADHDDVGGVSEAIWIGHAHGVEIVPAVEMTVGLNGKEIHLLGYLINHNYGPLREALEFFRRERFRRMERMIEKLRKVGVNIYLEAVRRNGGPGTLGRLHLARTLFEHGKVGSVQEAFDRFIGRGKPAFVDKPIFRTEEACCLINEAGGVPVLAHPKLTHVDKEIPELVGLGIRGIEAYYPKHTPEETARYLAMAEKYNLVVTGGSDCHGVIKDTMLLGVVKLPYRYLEELREHARRRV